MNDNKDAERALSLIFRFKDCMRRYKAQTEDRGKKFVILGSLREYEARNGRPVTVSEIARISGLAMPNVSRLLKPFEKEGLIQRKRSGRTVSVILTPEGDAALAAQRDLFEQDIASALGMLGEEERSRYLACREKILSFFESKLENLTAGETGC